MDGSTRKVMLTELWDLQWHREYRPVDYRVHIPWLN
jgi:hypothetical protein